MMRRALLILGILALAGAWLGPLPLLARQAFFAHMAMHMIVVAIAAPLLALGIAGSSLDPVRRWPALFPPSPSRCSRLLVVWAWHTPALHHAARHGFAGSSPSRGRFSSADCLSGSPRLAGPQSHRSERAGAGVAALLLTSMHMTFLGALLALAPRPLYTHVAQFAGLTQLEDQHLGGAIMLVVGGVSHILGEGFG